MLIFVGVLLEKVPTLLAPWNEDLPMAASEL